MKKKILLILAPVGVIVLSIIGFQLLQATAPALEETEEEPRPVSLFVEEVRNDNLPLTVSTQGEVKPKTEIDLVAQVSGRIVWVSPKFATGGSFNAGEPLVRIDDTDYRLALTRAEAQVAQAETQVALAEANAEIARRQWDDSVVGEPTALALKLPQLQEARASLKSAQADLEAARVNLQRTEFLLPYAGRVLEKRADVGQLAGPGTVLGRVFSTEVVEIRLPLTDDQLASLGLPIGYEANGNNAPTVTLTNTMAGEEHFWTGRLRRIEGAVDATTRVVYGVAEVEDPYGRAADRGAPLAVGLFVSARIEGRTIESAHVIPREALRADNRVYVVNDDDTLDIRTVTVMHTDMNRAVISAGLAAGERVVVSPVRDPRQGMRVSAMHRNTGAQLAAAGQ